MHCRHLTMMCGLASMFNLAAHVNLATAQCEIPLLPTDNGESDGAFLGASVAITEDLLVVGAPRPPDALPYGLGLVYLYSYDPQLLEWGDPEILEASDGTAENYFGRSVGMSGDVVIVGAPGAPVGEYPGAGKAYIYTFNSSTWDETIIQADVPHPDDRFGRSVAINGNWVIVGADQEDESGSDAGAAYLFHYDNGSWSFDTKLTPQAPAGGDRFGCSVALQGNIAIIGAWGDDDRGTDAGAVYVYRYEASSWSLDTKLTPPASSAGDGFGSSVALDGDAIIIGAPGDDDNGSDAGAAYVFRDSGASWEQEAKLLAVTGDAGDKFGTSVAISGVISVVGAPSPEWYLGDEPAVYVFLYQDPLWTYEATLRNAAPAGKTEFGYSVGAGDGFAAAGGPWAGEDWFGAVYVLGGMRDCNANGILDACEIFETTSEDCNGNWVPDECDVDPSDPDGNGQVSDDCQPDGIPDECQARGGADIIFLIDGSGSIGSAMYQLQKDGIINYVCGPDTIVPRDGTATLTLIEFWDEAEVQIDPMVIDSPSQADLFCYRVSQLNQPGSLNTYMASA